MLANASSLLTHNPIVIYSVLAAYGIAIALVITYVHTKFRGAAKTLMLLQTEWHSAESKHSTFVGMAEDKLSKLSKPAPPVAQVPRSGLGLDMRNQIVTMAKRGIRVNDIARTCGLQEGEVDVILGMARLQQ